MNEFIRKTVRFLLLQFLLIFVGIVVWLGVPKSQFVEQDYLQSIVDNRARLSSMNESRIVIIGGSSLGFSVSARVLSGRLGQQVMNTGVHAGLGYENQWHLYEGLLDPRRDIIVLSPEYKLLSQGRQYTNTYCRILFLHKDIARTLKSIRCLPFIFVSSMRDLWPLFNRDEPIRTVYYRSGFNEFGDLQTHFGLPKRNFAKSDAVDPPPTSEDIERYIQFVDSEIAQKGFQIVYIPTVIPYSSCEGHYEIIREIQERLIGAIGPSTSIKFDELCFADSLFFDTAYHLGQTGSQRKTDIFYQSLMKALYELDN